MNDELTMQGYLGFRSGLQNYQSQYLSENMRDFAAQQHRDAYERQLRMQQQIQLQQPAKPTDDPLLVLLTEE